MECSLQSFSFRETSERKIDEMPSSTHISEKAMAPHSSTLAWKFPWMEEPAGLRSLGSQRVGDDWATSLFTFMHWEGNGNLLQCSCLENPRDGGAWWAAIYGAVQSQTWVKWLSSSSSIMKKDQTNTKYPNFPLQRCKGHEIYYNTVERIRVTGNSMQWQLLDLIWNRKEIDRGKTGEVQ